MNANMVMKEACSVVGEDIVAASGKLGVLDRLLAKLQAKGHRVVLFSQACSATAAFEHACSGMIRTLDSI